MKKCSKCGKKKSTSDFYKCKHNKDGLHTYCKSCLIDYVKRDYSNPAKKEFHLEKDRNRARKIRRSVQEIKRASGCVYCGEDEPVCLDFHHKDPSIKDDTISQLIAKKSMKRVLKEISKCIVVCSNCHRKIHAGLLP